MIKQKPGRPKKFNPDLKLVTVDKAVELIKEELMKRYQDEVVVRRMSYTRGTLFNMRSNGDLVSYGDARCALLDADEVIRKLCG